MMPLRFGYCWSSPCVTCVAVVGSSFPYTVLTSFIFGYFLSSVFMYPIQAFWFVAEAAAETIAISPLLWISLASRSTSLVPIWAVEAWFTNRFRHAGASESYVTTVMCLAMAEFSVGQSAAGSVADTISALAPLVIAAWIAGICEAGVAAVPLVSVPVSPSALRAASAPPDLTLSAVVKYGLPRFFGMTKTFRPVLIPPAP